MNKVERERIETRRPYTSQQQGRQPCPRHRPRIIQPSLPILRHRHLARARGANAAGPTYSNHTARDRRSEFRRTSNWPNRLAFSFFNLMHITYKKNLDGVDWPDMKATLKADGFDNGRSAAQLKISFSNSQSVCLAYADNRLIGTARALSDDGCNAYIVDVWTHSDFRRQGIATRMMELLLAPLEGQHIYLFTEPKLVGLYQKVGFAAHDVGLGKVQGKWLVGRPPSSTSEP
ncbi:MAG: GNAT family N-acetyltransferase [Candidatus Latescibacterota bacterium]|jgi:ribosomal protein S18 acetylase RimI-like enzyme